MCIISQLVPGQVSRTVWAGHRVAAGRTAVTPSLESRVRTAARLVPTRPWQCVLPPVTLIKRAARPCCALTARRCRAPIQPAGLAVPPLAVHAAYDELAAGCALAVVEAHVVNAVFGRRLGHRRGQRPGCHVHHNDPPTRVANDAGKTLCASIMLVCMCCIPQHRVTHKQGLSLTVGPPAPLISPLHR